MSSSKIQGIYRVTLSPTHFYVGRSSDIKRRLRDHLGLLKRGRHLNAYMQSVYNQFHHFDWELLVACADAGEAVRAEQALLDSLIGTKGCVNLAPTAEAGPGMHTEETKALIREKRSRQVYSDETRRKISLSSMGNQRAKGHKRRVSEVTRRKLSDGQKGKTLSEAHRQALSRAWEGRAATTKETRTKLVASLKAHWERVRQGQAAHGKVKLGSTFSDVFV